MFEVVTWLVYALAAVMMLAVIAAAILAGLALRFVAEFLREIGDGREEGDVQPAGDDSRPPRGDAGRPRGEVVGARRNE